MRVNGTIWDFQIKKMTDDQYKRLQELFPNILPTDRASHEIGQSIYDEEMDLQKVLPIWSQLEIKEFHGNGPALPDRADDFRVLSLGQSILPALIQNARVNECGYENIAADALIISTQFINKYEEFITARTEEMKKK